MIELVNRRTIAIDDTLTKKGYAADAAAIGEAIRGLEFPEDFNVNDYAKKDKVDEGFAAVDAGFAAVEQALSEVYTKEEVDNTFAKGEDVEKALTPIIQEVSGIDKEFENYYTKTETDTAIKAAVDEVELSGGANGKDGVSCTHEWSGTTLTITSASGTSSANLKGEKGETGADGYTPIKGTDYYTEADKTEMVNLVIAALPVYNGEVV